MGKKDVLDILKRFRAALESRQVRVDKVVLFGSWAKGTAREDSDIDVVVVSPDFSGKDLWSRARMLGPAAYEVFAPIQALALSPLEWDGKTSTVCELAKDGELLAV